MREYFGHFVRWRLTWEVVAGDGEGAYLILGPHTRRGTWKD